MRELQSDAEGSQTDKVTMEKKKKKIVRNGVEQGDVRNLSGKNILNFYNR